MQNTIYMPFSASVIRQVARMWIDEQKEPGEQLAILVYDLLSTHEGTSDFAPAKDEPDEWTEKWGEIDRMVLETVDSMLVKVEKEVKRYADCHPELPHWCKGMCRKCYNAYRWLARHPKASIDTQPEAV